MHKTTKIVQAMQAVVDPQMGPVVAAAVDLDSVGRVQAKPVEFFWSDLDVLCCKNVNRARPRLYVAREELTPE
jgi:hypothetical protein